MPKISQEKRNRISEHILEHLFSIAPESSFTSQISKSIARDEEFTKSILQDLEKDKIIIKVKKNSSGKKYLRREKWRLSNSTFEIYKKHQSQ